MWPDLNMLVLMFDDQKKKKKILYLMFLQLELDNTNMCCWFYVLNIVIEKKNLIKLKF